MKEPCKTAPCGIRMPAYSATWRSQLPEDEIGRQQDMKERLEAGCEVDILMSGVRLGAFRYAGIWDTMHTFYPLGGDALTPLLPEASRRYCRRDLRGREYLQVPYTLLADVITAVRRQSLR